VEIAPRSSLKSADGVAYRAALTIAMATTTPTASPATTYQARRVIRIEA